MTSKAKHAFDLVRIAIAILACAAIVFTAQSTKACGDDHVKTDDNKTTKVATETKTAEQTPRRDPSEQQNQKHEVLNRNTLWK